MNGSSVPLSRKRGWDELNQALAPTLGEDPFSAVEYESLPKRLRADEDVTHGPFFELMRHTPDIDQSTLRVILSDIAMKQCAYGDPETSEATRVQFMSAIFEHVVHMFRHAPGDRVALQVQPKLSGAYVQANPIVDFLITRGGKSVCVVEAKNWNFKKASAQNVLGMEVAVDNSNEECAYGIVTNYIEWKFLKRTDEGIERFCDGINHHGSSREEDIKRVASRLCAIIQALN